MNLAFVILTLQNKEEKMETIITDCERGGTEIIFWQTGPITSLRMEIKSLLWEDMEMLLKEVGEWILENYKAPEEFSNGEREAKMYDYISRLYEHTKKINDIVQIRVEKRDAEETLARLEREKRYYGDK